MILLTPWQKNRYIDGAIDKSANIIKSAYMIKSAYLGEMTNF